MSEIQVNTSDLHNGSQNLNSAAHELGEVQNQLGHISASVGDAYEGQLRDALEEIMGGAIHTGGRLQIRAHELGNELTTRANGFEAANQATFSSLSNISSQFNNQFPNSGLSGFSLLPSSSDQTKATTLLGIAGITGITATSLMTSILGEPKPKPITPGTYIGNIGSSVSNLEQISKSGFKEIGRFFNWVEGSKKAGNVGSAVKIGKGIKNKLINTSISFGFGVASDLLDGDHWTKAVGSEAIEAGLNLGIDLGIKYGLSFIPVVGQFYTGYKIGMALGGVAAGALEVAGMHEAASSLNGAIEYLDFTDRIGDAIFDYVANPPPVLIDSPLQPAPPTRLA